MGSILASLPKKPKVIASDNGNEFLGPVADMLLDKGIAHRLKPVGDVNADLAAKADAAAVYTKAQVDESLALKASVASVADGLSIKADQNSLDALGTLVSNLQPTFTALAPLRLDGGVLKLDGSAVPLGKFRLRPQTDAVILESYDDDGQLVTDSWQTVAVFGWNPDTNAAGLAVQSLSLGGSDLAVVLEQLGQQIATKASQAQLDFVGQNFQPRITAFAPLSLVPRTDAEDNPFSELSVDLSAKQDLLSAGTSLVFHEPMLQGTKIKSLAPGAGIQLTSTGDLVTISAALTDTTVNGDLSVTGLSQFQGIEASGVVADQVVWVTGDGAAQSIMFPGSLQLGKWRLRGTEAGELPSC
jgi:hypothetical protein